MITVRMVIMMKVKVKAKYKKIKMKMKLRCCRTLERVADKKEDIASHMTLYFSPLSS